MSTHAGTDLYYRILERLSPKIFTAEGGEKTALPNL